MQGKIIKIISNLYTVSVGNDLYECHARGKFRKDNLTPIVGDRCIIDADNNYILEILPRTNYLNRPLVANIDIAIIVTSLKEPDLSLNLLDKMISVITINKITPIICFTKLDLLTQDEQKEMKNLTNYYQKIGIKVFDNIHLDKLKASLKNKVSVLTGQTGAGKSSLLNKIDPKLKLKTGEISKALGRGRHTTRHVELYKIQDFYIVDTPGFSALDINAYTNEQIKDSFVEFKNFNCKFRNCMHLKEKECAVKDALINQEILESRYNNYQNFVTMK